jgi:hypothetical protein
MRGVALALRLYLTYPDTAEVECRATPVDYDIAECDGLASHLRALRDGATPDVRAQLSADDDGATLNLDSPDCERY